MKNAPAKYSSALTALLIVSVIGCARAKIRDERLPLQSGAINSAEVILVKEVTAEKAWFSGDKANDSARIVQEKTIIRERFTALLIDWLRKKGFKPQPYSAELANKAPVLETVVTGFDHGSGAARALIGMGAGSSNMEIRVRLTRGQKTLSDFDVVATSGGRGGLISMSSFLEAHITDGTEKIADYLHTHIRAR